MAGIQEVEDDVNDEMIIKGQNQAKIEQSEVPQSLDALKQQDQNNQV